MLRYFVWMKPSIWPPCLVSSTRIWAHLPLGEMSSTYTDRPPLYFRMILEFVLSSL